MRYVFYLCPGCQNKLIEQDVIREEDHKVIYCPNCGRELETVFSGREKVGDTTYKIILNAVHIVHNRKDKCLKTIMQVGNLSQREALEKLNTKDDVLFEGDLLHTYLSLRQLDKIDYMIDYTVIPEFPYARTFTQICPECEEETVYKEEEVNEDEVQTGFFCENCNDWIWYDVHYKYELDKTVYRLKVSLKGVGDREKKEILRMAQASCDKEITEDQIVVNDLAKNINDILGLLKAYDTAYEIQPLYPYRIKTFKKKLTDKDIAKLIAANPGLKVTAEQMNAL